MSMRKENRIEIWGGIEGTINRVGNEYHDQSEYSGHYTREGDIDLVASLGIRMLRYPVLWEKHQPQKDTVIDWSFADKNLTRLKQLNVEPIAGLVHHGSGPRFVNFFDGSFEEGVAHYAGLVAERFPWLEYYTPINEPLTTARFCGLYGHWYPHLKDSLSFYRILLSECRATVMAMKAIREINPHAKLIQTEDLSKAYSTPFLQGQADLENKRRWLSYDLLCGKVTDRHPLWDYLVNHIGLHENELNYFTENTCIPDVCGFNYYVTSERYLDEDLSKYPACYHGGNGMHRYADVEIVRVPPIDGSGPAALIREAYEHVQLPIAITECHLHCTREEQMRWFHDMWQITNKLKADGVDVRALTAWAIFGLHGWSNLVREPWGAYEPGVFNIRTGHPKPTALARLIQVLARNQVYHHPVLTTDGWWKRDTRILYPAAHVKGTRQHSPACQPVLILGESGALCETVSRICSGRNIHSRLLSSADLDITDNHATEKAVKELRPWAIIHAAENLQVHDETKAPQICFAPGYEGPSKLTGACRKKQVSFFPDLVFDTSDNNHYMETGNVHSIGTYGRHKMPVCKDTVHINTDALVVLTSNVISPWDNGNFASSISGLKQGKRLRAANVVYGSLTFVPNLVHETLDLLLDNEHAILHISDHGKITEQFSVKPLQD